MANTNILDDYAEPSQVAADFNKCERTILRWMAQPDGLPYAKIGNKRLVHIPSAREWILKRVRQPNARGSNRRSAKAA
jgi:hypothetical protein